MSCFVLQVGLKLRLAMAKLKALEFNLNVVSRVCLNLFKCNYCNQRNLRCECALIHTVFFKMIRWHASTDISRVSTESRLMQPRAGNDRAPPSEEISLDTFSIIKVCAIFHWWVFNYHFPNILWPNIFEVVRSRLFPPSLIMFKLHILHHMADQ